MTRAILSFNLNMLIPISKVDANMQTAQKRDACLSEKFYFRKNIFTSLSNGATDTFKACNGTDECDMTEMSINEIVNGNDKFPGLIQIINNYLSNLDVDVDTQCTIKQYLNLIESRANGKLMTTASWMRKFVQNHPKYKKDSCINEEINYDLMWRIYLISSGQIKCPELLPNNFQTKSTI
jgi:glutamate--cysteine ligase catalytic subunit